MEHWLFVGFALVLVILGVREVYLSTVGRRRWFDAARRFGLSPRGDHPSLEASGTYRGVQVHVHHEVRRAGKSLQVTHIISLTTPSDTAALIELLQAHGFDAQQEGT